MNNDEVKKALHVDKAPVGTWSDCSNIDYHSNLVSLIPTYPKLIANMNVSESNISMGGVRSRAYTRCSPAWRCLCQSLCMRFVAQVLIYSGDADACVPWNGSYNWTRHLGMEETKAWAPWMVQADGRSWTGGFVTQWGANFTYLTIKHAGHMSDTHQPQARLQRTLSSTPLSSIADRACMLHCAACAAGCPCTSRRPR